jgi:hypothetical protein
MLSVQSIIDARARKTTHIIFGFRGSGESALAGKLKILTIAEIDVATPGPRLGVAVPAQYGNVSLVPVYIGDLVARTLTAIFHDTTLVGREPYRKRFLWTAWLPAKSMRVIDL